MPGFSPQSITALVEAATGGTPNSSSSSPAKYRRGTEIEMLLGNSGIDLQIGMDGRVPATRTALTAINRTPNADERLKPLFEALVNPADYASERDEPKHAPLVAYLNRTLRADGYELVESDGRFRLLAVGAASPAAEAVRARFCLRWKTLTAGIALEATWQRTSLYGSFIQPGASACPRTAPVLFP